MIYVILLYALFASVFTITKFALASTAPIFLVGARMLLAGGLILPFLWWFSPKTLRVPRSCWLKVLGLSVFNIYLTNVLEFLGLQYLTSFKTCFIYSLSPFVSAILSYLFLYEKMTPKKWLGLAIGVVGMVPILLYDGSGEKEIQHIFVFSWAELSVMGAACATVLGWILMRKLVTDEEQSPLAMNGYSMLIGGVISLVHSSLVEPWNPIPVTSYSTFLICSVALMVISNFICYNLYGWLLKQFSAPFMSFAGYTTPFFAAMFGWFFLSETITLPFYLSGAIVLSGLVLFYQGELQQGVRFQEQNVPVNE